MLNLDYDNYIELYEAVYFFHKISHGNSKMPRLISEEVEKLGINQSVHTAVMRILAVTRMIEHDGNNFVLTDEMKEKHRHVVNHIINKNQKEHYMDMFRKAVNQSEFFFDSMSEIEYDIYSRYNFQVSFHIGKEVIKHMNLNHSKVLELGGNSGGLATALLAKSKDCSYTVVDTKIPCIVGDEFKKSNGTKIQFIESDIFELMLPNESYDYIIIMNLLHDFNDRKCFDILRNCIKYCDSNTKFYIIEDVLTGEFEPEEAVMHGLRLSVSCRGGKQRRTEELASLFSNINYGLEKIIKIDNTHTMLAMHAL